MPARSSDREPISFAADLTTIEDTALVRLPKAASDQLPSRGQVAVEPRWVGTASRPSSSRTAAVATGSASTKTSSGLPESARVTPPSSPWTWCPDWPEPDVPDDLAAALADAPSRIRDVWQDITPMARWEWVRWVQATRNPQTRATSGRGQPLEDGRREAAALLLRPVVVHRPEPLQERQAARRVVVLAR